ncbi:hypothetical protein N7494_013242 [Penicillium frequentans]|uniref:C2H2-type domain-containing protein n=1 Tax=Penicillium frequentans TaxID=3151616 RepID=A0AAD6G8W7_9EURO|nr:hypothetical protein N7494_013242 [Penicillium glabrum]
MLHHLGSGACSSGMDREKINLMCVADTVGDAYSDIPDTDSDLSAIKPHRLIALQRESLIAFAVRSCHKCDKVFKSLQSLDKHPISAAHEMRVFHCPVSLLLGDRRSGSTQSFTTISGLAQHVESKSCVGGIAMLRDAALYLESRFQQVGWMTKILVVTT